MGFHMQNSTFLEVRAITLQGVPSKEIDVIENKLLMKILRVKGIAYMVNMIELDEDKEGSEPEPYAHTLQDILEEYSEVFDSP